MSYVKPNAASGAHQAARELWVRHVPAKEIAERTRLPQSTVYQVCRDLPRINRSSQFKRRKPSFQNWHVEDFADPELKDENR